MTRFAAALIVLALGSASAALPKMTAAPQQPDVLSPVAPVYPPIARAARAAGEVFVEVRVTAAGRVSSAEAVGGHPLLRQAATNAALRWQFKPDVRASTVRLTFEFRVEPADEESKPGSPYHLIINRPKAPDTVSHIPADAEDQTCEAHGFKLERDKVDIVYGLLVLPGPGEAGEIKTLFPHSNSWVGGGREIYEESPKYAEVLYCRACRAAEEAWTRERRLKSGGA